jgi:hypothetical protein
MKVQLMQVRLEAQPNPGYGKNDERGRINIEAKRMTVRNYKEASVLCKQFIEKNSLGGGNWTGGRSPTFPTTDVCGGARKSLPKSARK